MLDIVFVIGSNGNKAKEVFDKEKDIVKKMLDSGTSADTKYSVIQYGKNPKAVTKGRFSELSSAVDVNQLLDRLQWEEEGDKVDAGLTLASELFKSDSRSGARKVLVVFAGDMVQSPSPGLTAAVTKLTEDRVSIVPVVLGEHPDPSTFATLVPKVKNPVTGTGDEDSKGTSNKIGEVTFTGIYLFIWDFYNFFFCLLTTC